MIVGFLLPFLRKLPLFLQLHELLLNHFILLLEIFLQLLVFIAQLRLHVLSDSVNNRVVYESICSIQICAVFHHLGDTELMSTFQRLNMTEPCLQPLQLLILPLLVRGP